MTTRVAFSSSSNGTDVLDYFKQCDGNRVGVLIWAGFTAIVFMLGFPANMILIVEVFRRRRQKASNDLFQFNLTAIDLLFTGILPFSVCNFTTWHNLTIEFILNFIYNLALTSRPLFMACICVDCYFAVLHPIMYMTNKMSTKIRKTTSTIIWLFTAGLGLYMAATPYAFTTPLFSVSFIIALPVITFCDVAILQGLRRSNPSTNNSIHPQKKKALHIIISSYVMTFLVYLPPLIFFSFGAMMVTNKKFHICILAMIGLSFSMNGSVIMPILYLDSLGKLNIFKEWWPTITTKIIRK